MYVLFEQRERGQEGSSFVESAWKRFYRDLDLILSPSDSSPPVDEDEGSGGADDLDDADYDAALEPGAA
ncbi:MAG: hypothetical protein CVV47_00125 [Spirochaetae bacterium HGW-Spirochaetae-3]|jgi:hypothetical protein|nr:MAG: hypothetical protein CVV47_00125 [Spirochaetae bacterium HGW-Spirochaetae-3]